MALLEIDGLSISFGGIAALKEVSLKVLPGEIHGVIGPNGAGKTTLINAVTGIVRPRAGAIHFDGHPITGLAPDAISSRGLMRTFQHGEVFGGSSVLDNVLTGFFCHQNYGIADAALGFARAKRSEREMRERAMRLLEMLSLEDAAKRQASELPFGLQKRLDLARALAAGPRLLLLDEPVSGMSEGEASATVAAFKKIAQERAITLLAVEHNMRVLMSLATTVTVLNQGRVLTQGRPDEVQKNPAVIEAYLGEDA
jgi:branched-chain amino acid transport system ATP-binding protein